MENRNKKNINNNPEENKESKDKKRKSIILYYSYDFFNLYMHLTQLKCLWD